MSNLLPWDKRPIEVANLFNPAFCALLLRTAIIEYQKKSNKGLDYPTAFLILPLILHQFSRNLLPSTTKSKLHTWLQEHQEIKIGLNDRVYSLSRYTKEALIYGLQYGILKINDEGEMVAPKLRLPKFSTDSSEATLCIEKAGMLGRWFPSVGNTVTLLAMWGLRL